jgi:glucosamine--fructose-6-phosphate aminotransferase (isomerizing)
MCGIVGYSSKNNSINTLIEGLKRLEYRGYDSAGIAFVDDNELKVVKAVGKVANLEQQLKDSFADFNDFDAFSGIAHTRWATHGAPTEPNAHPHIDSKRRFAVVHNGIIENHTALQSHLESKGCIFSSETDSEVIPHLIGECYEGDLQQAVAAALKQVEGTYGIAVISLDEPNTIITARRGSPIVIGLGEDATIIASDITALVAYTRRVIYLDDNDIATITGNQIEIRNINNVPVEREIANIDWESGTAEKDGFEHFMLKEIFEQPTAVGNSIRGRLDDNLASAVLNGLNLTPRDILQINRIIIAACGTSLHAGMVGRYYFEELAAIPTDIEQAAEFRYRNPIIAPNSLVIPISQSGETADTLAAVREAINKGAMITSICNTVGSTIAREAGSGIFTYAGPEIGVASTKAFTCQVAVLLTMALLFGRNRRMSHEQGTTIIEAIKNIPELIEQVLNQAEQIKKIADKYADSENCFFIGRDVLFPTTLEGALKLKEISYIHAEGYHAAELKHGPIALLEAKVPVIALANDIPGRDKILGNIQECKARKSPVIATATIGDNEIKSLADDVIWIPACHKLVSPIPTIVALQLFSYYIAAKRGCEIDQPRNLAKSVTVE